jgi:predicted nucleic acid-binding protein
VALTVLDASIVIAVLDTSDTHHEAASRSLRRRLEGRDRLVLPVTAYAEALVAPIRRGADAVATLDGFLTALPCAIEAASESIGRHAAGLRAQHGAALRLPDAFVIATAIELGADRVLTADRRWPSPAGVTVEVV